MIKNLIKLAAFCHACGKRMYRDTITNEEICLECD